MVQSQCPALVYYVSIQGGKARIPGWEAPSRLLSWAPTVAATPTCGGSDVAASLVGAGGGLGPLTLTPGGHHSPYHQRPLRGSLRRAGACLCGPVLSSELPAGAPAATASPQGGSDCIVLTSRALEHVSLAGLSSISRTHFQLCF